MHRRLLVAPFLAPFLVLTACGGDGDAAPEQRASTAEQSPSAKQSPTARPSETPLPTTTAAAARIAVAALGTNAARSREEKAVVATWMTYWRAVVKTYDELEPAAGLDVARGLPRSNVLDYLDELKAQGERSVGWTRENVLDVEVDGSSAVLVDCAENFTFTVDSANRPTEEITPFYTIRAKLAKESGRWVITSFDSRGLDEDCR